MIAEGAIEGTDETFAGKVAAIDPARGRQAAALHMTTSYGIDCNGELYSTVGTSAPGWFRCSDGRFAGFDVIAGVGSGEFGGRRFTIKFTTQPGR